jgi:hypothetical protein
VTTEGIGSSEPGTIPAHIGALMPLRDVSKMRTINHGTLTLYESVMLPGIISTLQDWSKTSAGGILAGALTLSYYVRPRMTQDVDFLFLSDEDVPRSIIGFTRLGGHEG